MINIGSLFRPALVLITVLTILGLLSIENRPKGAPAPNQPITTFQINYDTPETCRADWPAAKNNCQDGASLSPVITAQKTNGKITYTVTPAPVKNLLKENGSVHMRQGADLRIIQQGTPTIIPDYFQ